MSFDLILYIGLFLFVIYKVGELVYIKIKGGSFEKVTMSDFKTYLSNHKANTDFLLLDVRTEVELKLGRIGGAINIPLKELKPDEQRVLRFKGKPIVIYCQSGSRSKTAAKKLAMNGYKPVYYVAGGYSLYKGDATL